MTLPLLSLDLPTFEANRRAMFELCRRAGVLIAPHAKTPMSPRLAGDMIEHGAWGASVADLRQAGVMLRHGLDRLLIANEIGGRAAAARLAALLRDHPRAETFLFVDSPLLVEALDAEWPKHPQLPVLKLLIDVGCGRGGVHTRSQAQELVRACAAVEDPRIGLAGVAAYEGSAMRPAAEEMRGLLDDLFLRLEAALTEVRRATGPGEPLLLSAGGSTLFDMVIARGLPIAEADGNTRLLLRCGSLYFGDHGAMPERFAAVVKRNLLGPEASALVAGFQPALRIWAEVLSVHGGTAICGLGLRDAAQDQGLPVPLQVWRDGATLVSVNGGAALAKLNDQHGFLDAAGLDLKVGDVIEFGVRHPCTSIQNYELIFGLGADGKVRDVLRTFFG